MCYSVESSAKTSLLAFISIAVLFSSNVPHFKWIAMTMTGWCLMQVAEFHVPKLARTEHIGDSEKPIKYVISWKK